MIWPGYMNNGTPQTLGGGGASDNGTRKYKWPYQNSETNGGNGLKI